MNEQKRNGAKRNTIRKIVRCKVDAWLKTIEDDDLRDQMKKDIIVTGGSIASLLMGDEVKDYDVYFRTIETTEAVVKHYVDQFKELGGHGGTVVRKHVLNLAKETETRVVISDGGSKQTNAGLKGHIEIQETFEAEMYEGSEDGQPINAYLKAMDEDAKDKYIPIYLSQNAITLSGKIQIVHRFYGEPEQIHRNYDFIHACCHYDYAADEVVLKVEALEAMMSKTLVYTGSLYPICSLFRMKKFINRGWRISAGEMLKIIFQLRHIDFEDPEVLKEQLTGVDFLYLQAVVREIENAVSQGRTIDDDFIVEVIDKAFRR